MVHGAGERSAKNLLTSPELCFLRVLPCGEPSPLLPTHPHKAHECRCTGSIRRHWPCLGLWFGVVGRIVGLDAVRVNHFLGRDA